MISIISNSTKLLHLSKHTINSFNKSISGQTVDSLKAEETVCFDKFYPTILQHLTRDIGNNNNNNELIAANEWIRRVIDYNVPHGKRNRGLMCVLSYRLLVSADDYKSSANLDAVRALGWALELFQTYFLIIDDIMDNSRTRRGRTCWHCLPNVGLIACNDAALVESGIYQLIKQYFKGKPYYMDIVELVHEIFRKTAYGQCLDLLSTSPYVDDRQSDLNSYTIDRYSTIVKYKTAYYTFVLPVRLAMYITGHNNPSDHQIVENILLMIGHVFQVQDDYLDCFGDPSITGKVGTDIQDRKCCWLIVRALELCNDRQRQLLQTQYGLKSDKSVKQIKQIYHDLNLVKEFRDYETHCLLEIKDAINRCKYKLTVPETLFAEPLAQIYKRNK
ncbi:uncharacterized protein LOC128955781 [Oppia nitens]|uniref:uncharacterized protein LOC128955781 n=1 Tax=Oppia nitens TaxID=1686743 RepID=UPI0023DBCABE|nr:uncharacterized protein LOC128955781 [Oppia nitens]